MFVVCYEILTNYAMKPSLLPRHFEPKQKDLKNKAMEFLKKIDRLIFKQSENIFNLRIELEVIIHV